VEKKMKRISFFLALVLTVFAFSMSAQAQDTWGEVSWTVGGPAALDATTIGWNLGNPGVNEQGKVIMTVTFTVGAPDDNIIAFTNGFEMYDNSGGMSWAGQGPTGDKFWDPGWFPFGESIKVSTNGSGVDSLVIAGAGLSPGFPVSWDAPIAAWNIWLDQDSLANTDKVLCFDTLGVFFGTALLQWKWGRAGTTNNLFPTVGTARPQCFDVVYVPDQAPEISNAPVEITGDHCGPLQFDFDAEDRDGCSGDVVFELVAGPGNIDPATGVWTYQPSLGDVGASLTITVRACCPSTNCGGNVVVNINPTNNGPTFTLCPAGVFNAQAGVPVDVQTTAVDDCDGVTYPSAVVNEGATAGTASVGLNTGLVTFTPDGAYEGVATVTVTATDGDKTAECVLEFNVSIGAPYSVYIEKDEGQTGRGALQGHFTTVDVWLETSAAWPGGFSFLMAYDASALSFMRAIPNPLLFESEVQGNCEWEYFTYRTGPWGNCSGGCPSGMVSVTAMAETNDGPNHPTEGCVPNDNILFSLEFLVSSDRNLECSFVPIRFFWVQCQDNTMSNWDGDELWLAQRVFDYAGFELALYNEIYNFEDPDVTPMPSYQGPDPECYVGNEDPRKPQPIGQIDFYNGGIDIICAPEIDDRGDINLNAVPYEIADAVIFTNYFVYGQAAFEILAADPLDPDLVLLAVAAATAASDVNADGLVLTVSDLVYLIRVVVGDAFPVPEKTNPVDLAYTVSDGVVNVDGQLGAMYLVLNGNVNVDLLASDVEIKQNYDADANVTKVIVYSMNDTMIEGDVVSIGNARIDYVEAALFDGTPVRSLEIPSTFSVAQNYPNPFNPTTTIEFSLPASSDVSVKIYNVTGQLVKELNGHYDAGVHQVEWNASDAASGVYFYRVVTDTAEKTMKMVLLK
jgi:hypothetical protein